VSPETDPTPTTVAELSSMSQEQFVDLLGSVFEHTPSIAAAAWHRRPFDSVAGVHSAMNQAVAELDDDQVRSLLQAHPELGSRRPMAAMSVDEQRSAGLDRVEDATAHRLAELNASYRERFGFPFIIAVRGRDSLEVMAALHQRMLNEPDTERATALEQVLEIARLRLDVLLIDEPSPDGSAAGDSAEGVGSEVGTVDEQPPGHDALAGRATPVLRALPEPAVAPVEAVDNATPGLEHAWHPVALSSEVGDEPVRVMLLDQAWVLFRTDEGLAAMADRCVHRGAPLSAGCVVEGTVECPYHGWRFGADGRCVEIPALAGGRAPARARVAVPAGLVERYGLVWLAPEQPAMDLIEVPEAVPGGGVGNGEASGGGDGFGVVLSAPVRTTASAAQVVDNFLDVTHFSYLHRGTFGLTQPVTVEDYVVERGPWQVTLHHRTMFSAGDEPARPRVGHYCCTIPFSVRLVGEFPGSERSDVICLFAQPETATSTRVYKLLAYNELGPGSPADRTLESMDAFETAVLAEDVAMLELLPDTAVQLSPTAEFHTKADRATVEWRRLLRSLLERPVESPVAPAAHGAAPDTSEAM
jgi:vanillate O-demethylase monooxygenase subunit